MEIVIDVIRRCELRAELKANMSIGGVHSVKFLYRKTQQQLEGLAQKT